MSTTLKTLLIIISILGLVHSAFAYNFSDLKPDNTRSESYDYSDIRVADRSSNSYDYSNLGPVVARSATQMSSEHGMLKRQSTSWDFSDLGPLAKSSEGYDFSHDKFREVLYGEISPTGAKITTARSPGPWKRSMPTSWKALPRSWPTSTTWQAARTRPWIITGIFLFSFLLLFGTFRLKKHFCFCF